MCIRDRDNLDPPLNPGWYDYAATGNTEYWVEIASSNFNPGGALENYVYTGDLASQSYSGPEPRRVTLIGVIVDWNDADFGYALAGIELTKVANDTPDGGTTIIQTGETVTYTYRFTNTGETHLSTVVITDDNGTLGVPGDDFQPCTTFAGPYAPSSGGQCQWITTVSANRTNIATVVGNPVNSSGVDLPGNDATDSDDAVVTLIGPEIMIDKVPDTQQVVTGGTAQWTIYVTNTGDVALTTVTVTDALAPNCDRSLGSLGVGASTSYACSRSGVTADFTNVAAVTGDPPVGPPVTDNDDADVDLSLIHI